MTAFVAAGLGFLLAVLWFDLMHDVLLRRGEAEVTEEAVATVAGYYRRVTTQARPMNRLVALAMGCVLCSVVLQILEAEAPRWVAVSTAGLAASAIGLAAARTVRTAVRLGERRDPVVEQIRLGRSILRDHLVCLVLVVAALVLELGFGR